MLYTPRARRGMATSPHHLATEAGLRVLRDGGNAIEATVAMAACLAVVYPHMTGIGGDGFWLISRAGAAPVAIDACGAAAGGATWALYESHGLNAIPTRGPLAANTVAGTVGGWGEALQLSARISGRLPLPRLLEDAIWLADNGFPVTASQHQSTTSKLAELKDVPGFAASFLCGSQPPREGELMRLPKLGATLRRIARLGTDEFYRGELAREIAADLEALGSPLRHEDLAQYRAQPRAPLSARLRDATLFNFPPPTQGLASLMILALFERLGVGKAECFDHVHGLIEATKQAFLVRDDIIGHPEGMTQRAEEFLRPDVLDKLAARIDRTRALAWPRAGSSGDTVWLGAIDAQGNAVSFIQSIFFEFGSGCVLPGSGIAWQNRGASFQLRANGPRRLAPGHKPFHTLNPAMALFDDKRMMVYGTMGGEGQPQTQAALFSRYAMFGQGLQAAITAPRWLLGKTWGDDSVSLKMENRFEPALIDALQAAGHTVEPVGAFSSTMGHAGAVVMHHNGVFEGAADPRSDGAAMGF